MDEPLDYGRYGRQIALMEIGADGQRALAQARARFVAAPGAVPALSHLALQCAGMLHERAGGHVGTDAGNIEVVLEVPVAADGFSGPLTIGIAAIGAVEAARRVLGQSPTEIPRALIERLGMASPTEEIR